MQHNSGLRWLTRADVLAAGGGDFWAASTDVQDTLMLSVAGEAGMEPESVLPMGADPRDKAYGLPAWVGGRFDAVGIKWSVHRAAPTVVGSPSNVSFTLLNSRSDGRPMGLVESAHLTCMRTAIVSALAMERLLTVPPARITLLGAGAQAQCHLNMLATLFPAAQITLWNRTATKAETLAAQFAGTEVAVSLATAIAEADCILCCTSSPAPILGCEAVRPDRLIVQVGYDEVGFDAIAASDVVAVDAWGEFAERSAKSLFRMYRARQFRPEEVTADLATLMTGSWRPTPGQSVYFSSFGLNFFDIALAARVVRVAVQRGLGQVLAPFDPKGDL